MSNCKIIICSSFVYEFKQPFSDVIVNEKVVCRFNCDTYGNHENFILICESCNKDVHNCYCTYESVVANKAYNECFGLRWFLNFEMKEFCILQTDFNSEINTSLYLKQFLYKVSL